MERMKVCHVLSITHHSSCVIGRPWSILISNGIVPKTLAEDGAKSGSALGTQAPCGLFDLLGGRIS